VVRIGGRPFEIIGVAPERFEGVVTMAAALRGTGVWIPLGANGPFFPGGGDLRGSERPFLTVLGRLRSDVRVEAAAREVAGIASALDASDPIVSPDPAAGSQRRGWTALTITGVRAELVRDNRLGVVLSGLVALVLLVACTNLANLVLARGTTRQQDFVVRRALGAGLWRLVREQLAESAILAIAGGIAAYGVMRVTAALATRDLPLFADFTLSIQPRVESTTLGVAAAALLLSLIVF
jgi:hypothetical protein